MANFPDNLTDEQVKALKAGYSISVDGVMKDASHFGLTASAPSETVGLAYELQQANLREAENLARIAQLETALADKGEAFDHADLLEDLIPDSESGLNALKAERVAKIAQYRGIETDGKDKKALIGELLKKPEES